MARSPDDCPYRIAEANCDSRDAYCKLLQQITNVQDAEFYRVTEEMCAACCGELPPSPIDINSVVASLIYELTGRIIELGGVRGCDVKLAKEIKRFAYNNLAVVRGADETDPSQLRYSGTCLYLCNQIGSRDCSCSSKLRVGVYTCRHPEHDETTTQLCRKCLDYEPELTKGAVRTWAVGITTAPRPEPTLEKTLSSLLNAGWAEPHVFAEPGVQVSSKCDLLWTQRIKTLGAWPNWLLGLTELVLTFPQADAYFMCQDDVVFCRGLRNYLEETLWPAPRVGVVSLYCPSHVGESGHLGFQLDDRGWDTWGALAYVFSNASARALLRSSLVVNHRNRGPSDGLRNVDSVVGQWCRDSDMPYFIHSPSLAQHVGETSTLFPNVRNEGKRRASTFLGEHAEIRNVIETPTSDGVQTFVSASDGCHVAVSIPVFENRHMLRRAVDSILNQSHRELTLFVTNDGGEPPWEELAGIDDPRLVRFDLSSNRGRYFVDSVILEATSAHYFLVQDSDDWSEPNRLAVLLQHLQEKDAAGAVSSRVIHDFRENSSLEMILRGNDVNGTPPSTYRHRVHHHGLFRTQALREIGGFYGGFRFAYDTFLMNLLLLTGRVAFADEPLYHYFAHAGSLSNHPDTGLGSAKRTEVHRHLSELYGDAYHAYLHFFDGELSRSQLCEKVRLLANRHVTANSRRELARESQRLRVHLRMQQERS